MRASICSAVAVALFVAAPGRGEAQRRFEGALPTVYLGFSAVGAQPQGEFGRVVDNAGGGEVELSVAAGREGMVRMHADLGGVRYGHEHHSVCAAAPIGCRIDLNLNTDNTIFFGGLGPEIALPGPISPYADATVGISSFRTYSTLGTDHDATDYLHDNVLAARVAGGIRLALTRGSFPLLLDLGARYDFNGNARYLIQGDVQDLPDGEVAFQPRESDANLLVFQLGAAVGFGGGGGSRGRAPAPRGRRR